MRSNSLLLTISQGGLFSLLVLIVLLVMSIISWAIIARKSTYLRSLMRSGKLFLDNLDFYNGVTDILYRAESYSNAYYAVEFQAAYDEYVNQLRSIKTPVSYTEKQDLLLRIERSIEKSIVNQTISIERGISVLATISSSAPFVGLFGTVAGIIDAFFNIGTQGAASIAVVAPGISTALVATAFGLFAAIPALIAYNVFRNRARIIQQQMESFGLELINLFDKEYSVVKKRRQVPVARPNIKQ